MAVILGPKHGHAALTGTHGNDVIVAQGGFNTINGGGGNDYVVAGTGGFAKVTFGRPGDGGERHSDTVALYGTSNLVTTGDENITAFGNITASGLALGNGSNSVSIAGVGNSVSGGAGDNRISALGGAADIVLLSNRASVVHDSIAVSGQFDIVRAVLTNGPNGAPGTFDITGGSGYGTFAVDAATTGNIVTGGSHNVITDSGSGTIVAGSGYEQVAATGVADTVMLAGRYNSVGTTGDATITGGSGDGYFYLGSQFAPPTAMLSTGGLHNDIHLDNVRFDVTAGSGNDTVSAVVSAGTVTFAGSGNQLMLTDQAGFAITVEDHSHGLDIVLQQGGAPTLTIDHFDVTGLIDLGTTTAYTNVQQVLNALHETSAGTYTLAVDVGPTSGTITFDGVGTLTAANFHVG